MTAPFFRPQEVHAEALVLVGYRLYPYARVELHPRLTLFAGGNGAGKTTLLDALQTILIADQRSLHLNVAAGQNDRDLGGQLQGRVAWAALQLKGHRDVQALGVVLSRRAATEYVDLKPFALLGIAPDQELFLNRFQAEVAQDLKALGQNVKQRNAQARVKDFSSVSDYHRFLYEEGLLPLDLSRSGRRQFSLLWRQATQPHLGELNSFLQQTLCHEPEKRLTFEDVEKLMKERLHTERQVKQLVELKELSAELQGKGRDLDHYRRRCLGASLGLVEQREHTLSRDIQEGEARFEALDDQIKTLQEELEAVRLKLEELGRERDRYLREQSEWSRKYKHFQEYTAARKRVDTLQEQLWSVEEDMPPLEDRLEDARKKIERTRNDMQALSNDLARWKDKESDLERQVRKWQEFQKDLERAATLLGRSIRSASDLESAWQEINEARRKFQEIKPLRQLLAQWETRAGAHAKACELAQKMIDLWPDFFEQNPIDRSLLDRAQTELRDREKAIALEKDELLRGKRPLKSLIDELSKGRLPLPPAAGALVEAGIAVPFTNRFDSFSLDAARECQERIGPLARAVEPRSPAPHSCEETSGPPPSLAHLAHGSEPFWLVLSPEVWKRIEIVERNEHGTIAAIGGIGWYTPNGAVWIGAEARREQIQKAQERLIAIEAQVQALGSEEDLLARRRRALQDFLPKLDAFADREAAPTVRELAQRVQELEQASPGIEKAFPVLQKLFQRSELFHFDQAGEAIEILQDRIFEAFQRYAEMEQTLKGLKEVDVKAARELSVLNDKVLALQRDLDKSQTICSRIEEEEPREVLEGQVDFGRTEELVNRVKALDEERTKVQNTLLAGERKTGELRNRYRTQSETLARLRHDLDRVQKEREAAMERYKRYYPREAPQPIAGARHDECERYRAVWENLAHSLRARISEVADQYDLRLPEEDQPDRLVPQLLELLLPPGIQLDHLEEQYARLQRELQQIEYKIKSHVEEVRSSVEGEIRRLRMHLVKVNRILSTLNFGQIKKITLELEELPAYQALKKLESLLRVICNGEVLTLREFVAKLRAFIQKESNTTLSEEQITDYRSYIRIRRVIVDAKDQVRETGLSSGETLGVNLALCLAILFFLGREQGVNSDRGMLLLALDEAERLDAKALETIRSLLDHVRCQLTVAMPRPINIPDSICHLLTPLTEGVTHVHLYHR